MRADLLLMTRGLAASRTVARRLIEAGRVRAFAASGGGTWQALVKPSQDLPPDIPLEVEADPSDRFVSRAGLKLAGALEQLQLDVAGSVCLDVGQSTGGFTDCLLQAGAARVVGVDVGHGQLHPRLAADPRVVCREGVNARGLTAEILGQDWPARGFDLIVADASFISLTLLLPRFPALLRAGGQVLALVKPQFEVGPGGIGKGGVVRDAARYPQVRTRMESALADCGLIMGGWLDSPILGGDGNREFFVQADKSGG